MDKERLFKHLDKAIEQQVPDAWDEIQKKIHRVDDLDYKEPFINSKQNHQSKKRFLSKRFGMVAAICLITVSTFTFTPALAAIQELYDKIFSSEHIDDSGLKAAIDLGIGQDINQAYYDKENDITVHFQNVLTDDNETKLLLSFQSKNINLENYYLDIFEGDSSVNLITSNGEKKKLRNYGWGSRFYDSKQNKVVEALSMESLKEYEGKEIRLEIENLNLYNEIGKEKIEATWPLVFTLNKSAVLERKTVVLNTEFVFKNETYLIKQVEFSGLETKVVVTGNDIGPHIRSKLENQLLNARKIEKDKGYIVDHAKSGVFLKSAGEKVEPIFSKNEIPGPPGEYAMIFAPVKNPQDTVLEVGEDIQIPLTK